jgi:hypothetical protein
VAVFYKIGRSGRWKYAADVVPGETVISIPQADFPEASAGEVIPVQFKAFDGELESPATNAVDAVVNHAPVITVNQQAEPIIHDFGQKLEVPFQVADTDGDPVTLFYKFDNAAEWSEAPASDTPNIFPASVFANLDPNVDHTMEVLAFDGYDESEPVQYGFFSFFKRIGRKIGGFVRKVAKKVVRFVKKAAPILSKVAGVAAKFLPGKYGMIANIASKGLGMIPQSTVSHSIDGDEWSQPVLLPWGDYELFALEDLPEKYLTPGSHTISLRYEEANSPEVTTDELHYYVNSPPVLQLTNDKPLTFASTSTNPVAVPVPISVSDVDAQPLMVFYRFNDNEEWSHLPTSHGEYILPADAFSDHLNDGNGVVQVFAWDGYDKSEETLNIPYSITRQAAQPEANEEEVAEESNFFDELSPGAFVGIAIGGVAVIALVVGIVVFVRRRKVESTTGLIESE